MTGVVCIIPTLNAGGSVGQVIAGLRAALPGAIIVGIDDGSTDDSGEILRARCDYSESFGSNRGKGAALRAGFRRAIELGAARVVAIDADGQHDPRCAPSLVAALDASDIAVGARARTGTTMPLRRRLSNALSSAAISAVAGRVLPDTQCGYRAFRREVIESIDALGDRYEFETDFIIRAARAGFRIATVPIPTIYVTAEAGGRSHFRECRDTARVVATIFRHRKRSVS